MTWDVLSDVEMHARVRPEYNQPGATRLGRGRAEEFFRGPRSALWSFSHVPMDAGRPVIRDGKGFDGAQWLRNKRRVTQSGSSEFSLSHSELGCLRKAFVGRVST